jgi:hypothetical protein
MAASLRAAMTAPIYIDHPQFEGFEVRQNPPDSIGAEHALAPTGSPGGSANARETSLQMRQVFMVGPDGE